MTIFGGGTIDGNILPTVTGKDLGAAATRWDGFFQDIDISASAKIPIVATSDLPAASTAMNGTILIEDNGTGNRNIIIYAGSQRFRIDGGANI